MQSVFCTSVEILQSNQITSDERYRLHNRLMADDWPDVALREDPEGDGEVSISTV